MARPLKLYKTDIQVAAFIRVFTPALTPPQVMTLSIDNNSYPSIEEFDFRDGIYEIEILQQNIEDQIATVNISKVP